MVGYISKSIVSSTKKMLVSLSLTLVIPPGVLCPVLVSPYRKAMTLRRQSSRGISKWEPTWDFMFVCLFPKRSLNLCYWGIKYDWELLFKSRLIYHLYCYKKAYADFQSLVQHKGTLEILSLNFVMPIKCCSKLSCATPGCPVH